MDYRFKEMDKTESTNCCNMLINGMHDINKTIIELTKIIKKQNETVQELIEENRALRLSLLPANN